jgi:hypothetical protein
MGTMKAPSNAHAHGHLVAARYLARRAKDHYKEATFQHAKGDYKDAKLLLYYSEEARKDSRQHALKARSILREENGKGQ